MDRAAANCVAVLMRVWWACANKIQGWDGWNSVWMGWDGMDGWTGIS